jgi:hypothetical protein
MPASEDWSAAVEIHGAFLAVEDWQAEGERRVIAHGNPWR